MRFIIVIPARYQSSRLPGKPLVNIGGVPMVVRTYRQCIKALPSEKVYVATDDERIAGVCRTYGMQYLMTSADCLTGTDRIAEASRLVDADSYINVQGDEPVFNPDDIRKLMEEATAYPHQILNGYCRILNEEQFRSSSIPKVVMRPDGRLLYMSRAPIPTNKNHGFEKALRQVCAYAFPKEALTAFVAAETKTALELIEDIEILRFLELGWDVRMIPMTDDSVAVDNPEDVLKAEAKIREMGL
ncbi:MAG TPA: 3-deoxy-manno-octulosonate cytidylyltransferase [Geobacteraceae bacterium]